MSQHRIVLARDPSGSLELISREAASWGGGWSRESPTGGRLELPVLAGLRHGWVEGPVSVEPVAAERSEAGSRLTFTVEKSAYRLQRTSVTVLAFAALGALVLVVAPFVRPLWPVMPIAFMLAIGAWLFIVARLRNSGPEEFLETLAQMAEGEPVPGEE